MRIEKKTIEKEIERVVKPAYVKHIDTGHKKIIKVIRDGETIEEERPIYDRAFIEAVKERAIERFNVFAVNDGIDEHQFATEAEAKDFTRGA